MICADCGYVMSDFDAECPRCHGKGINRPASSTPSPHQTQVLPPQPLQAPRQQSVQQVQSKSEIHPQAKSLLSGCLYFAVLIMVLPGIGFIVDSVRNQIPNREVVHIFFGLATFAAFICLVVGLISPSVFSLRVLGINPSRKRIGYVVGTAFLLFLAVFGSTFSDEEKARMAERREQEERLRAAEERRQAAEAEQRAVEEVVQPEPNNRTRTNVSSSNSFIESREALIAHERETIAFYEKRTEELVRENGPMFASTYEDEIAKSRVEIYKAEKEIEEYRSQQTWEANRKR